MQRAIPHIDDPNARFFSVAQWLAAATIFYNIIEGVVSVYFGFGDENLTLFGFGVDSFIEVISGVGIAHMILRIKMHPDGNRNKFERTALQVTGVSFYILVAGLILTSGYNIFTEHQPVTTRWGIIISLISIIIMWLLIYGKTKVGKALESDAILADAECTRVCVYMSVVLLVSSAIYELFRLPYVDVAGSLGLAYFSFKEGRECFEKARTNNHCHCH